MHFAGEPFWWQASEGMPQPLMTALYLRDAAGLDVRVDTVVPPLEPTVDLDAGLAMYATEQAAHDWAAWWETFFDTSAELLGPPMVVLDPMLASEVGVDLLRLIEAGYEDSQRWLSDQARAYAQERVREPHSDRVLITDITREAERRLGHRAAPFRLRISILPVEGVWGRRVRPEHVLASRHLRANAEAFRAFIEPVIDELADG
ncbi:MAG TPA: hypothetical protein VGZ32_20385 [Actinocrinis sp.]|jgi:hypothetical protein|uniref:hypothetical protein n=1 Tax=Actinocrinis sp. TaxID=1920516 RepID=UPI002DDD8AC2|nr:hypothetical protein [Actinocrinis sp.]HEV3172716.1 hypothetical protein [Actinocrinis sp.]